MRTTAEAYSKCGLMAEEDMLGVLKTIELEHSRARLRIIQSAKGEKYLSGHSQLPCFSKKDVEEPKWSWPKVKERGRPPTEGEEIVIAGGSRLWRDKSYGSKETRQLALWGSYPIEVVEPYIELAIRRSEKETGEEQ